jgi:polyphosphate kinase
MSNPEESGGPPLQFVPPEVEAFRAEREERERDVDPGSSDGLAAKAAAAVKVPPITLPEEPVPLLNREFSWLEFNRRVLAEAEDDSVPLLERLKFLAITASNLDEFFQVRVSGIRDLIAAGIAERTADGLTPNQQMKGIRQRTKTLISVMHACLQQSIFPELRKAGIRIEPFEEFSKKEQAVLRDHYERTIAPILTPLAIDPGHPFPFLTNLALNLAIALESGRGEEHTAFVRVPQIVERLVALPGTTRYIFVEDLIAVHVGDFFPGLRVRKIVPFRVIRNADISLREDEVQDLLQSVESEMRRRDRKEVIALDISGDADDALIAFLMQATRTRKSDVYRSPGALRLADLMQIYSDAAKSALKEKPFNPRIPSQLASTEDIFAIIRRGDIMLHRPYDSFTAVVEYVQAAVEDPDVVAIKTTLYRTDRGSPIVEALAAAALQGKQVTAVVELQARFDELKNIAWARRLEEAGVQVVYGLVGIKTHCKICLIVRRERGELHRYVHLSTGNYNAVTARLYTDIDLFTADADFGHDASQLMNILTGFSISSAQEIFESRVSSLQWSRFIVAPMDYHRWTQQMIEREIKQAKDGKPAQIIAKFNALVDPTTIQTLYRASQAGVRIDLIVRGACCLLPGVAGLSENIHVVSIVDRFLEHARIMLFRNGGNTEVYVSSGDWMPRNFFRRVELTFPIVDEQLKARIEGQILATALADNVKGWRLHPDGTYSRRSPGSNRVRSQERFIEIARSEAVRLGPYDEMIRKPGSFRRKAKKLKKKEKGKS